jgi:hypothetical protein
MSHRDSSSLKPHPEYRSFVLRLWREGPQQPWRLALIEVASRASCRVADLPSLNAYLAEQMTDDPKDDSRK